MNRGAPSHRSGLQPQKQAAASSTHGIGGPARGPRSCHFRRRMSSLPRPRRAPPHLPRERWAEQPVFVHRRAVCLVAAELLVASKLFRACWFGAWPCQVFGRGGHIEGPKRGLGGKLEMRQTVGRRAARGRVLRRGWGRGESHNAAGIGRCCERRSRETPDPKSQTITRQQRARLSLAHFTTHTHLLSGRDRSGGKKAHVGCIHPHKVNIRERCTLCTGMDVPSGSRSKYPPVGAGAWFARSKNGTMTRMTPPPPFSRAVYF